MNKFLMCFLFFMLSSACVAQSRPGTWSLIPKAGVNLANLSGFEVFSLRDGDIFQGVEVSRKSSFREGFIGGMDVQYQISEQLAASAGLYYSTQGMRFKGFDEIDENGTHDASNGFQWNNGYLALPVMLHGYVFQGLSVNLGLQVGYLLSAKGSGSRSKYTLDEDGKAIFLTDDEGNILRDVEVAYDNLSGFKRYDVSIPVGISYEYSNVVLDAKYQFGLTNIEKAGFSTYKNRVFTFTVGYKFDL